VRKKDCELQHGQRNSLFGTPIVDDLYSPPFRNGSPIRDRSARCTCIISPNVSIVCASYKVGRGRSLRRQGKVRKRGDVNWLPEVEAVVWYLGFLVSEVHPIKPKNSRFSLARSLLVVDHPLVYVSGRVLGWV